MQTLAKLLQPIQRKPISMERRVFIAPLLSERAQPGPKLNCYAVNPTINVDLVRARNVRWKSIYTVRYTERFGAARYLLAHKSRC